MFALAEVPAFCFLLTSGGEGGVVVSLSQEYREPPGPSKEPSRRRSDELNFMRNPMKGDLSSAAL